MHTISYTLVIDVFCCSHQLPQPCKARTDISTPSHRGQVLASSPLVPRVRRASCIAGISGWDLAMPGTVLRVLEVEHVLISPSLGLSKDQSQ